MNNLALIMWGVARRWRRAVLDNQPWKAKALLDYQRDLERKGETK